MSTHISESGEQAHLTNILKPKRWMQVVTHLAPRFGGMSTVVPRLASEVARDSNLRLEVNVFRGKSEREILPVDSRVTYSSWPTSRFAWLAGGNKVSFRDSVRDSDGLHIHGLWETSTAVAAACARQEQKPYVLSAHGMLEPWALSNKGLKKHVYSSLIEARNLQGAFCLHALTSAELQNYRQFGCSNPVAVIPNGVESPDIGDPSLFLQKYPFLRGKRIVLFLGRIHFKKGLDLLVPSWAKIMQEFPDAHLVLAGPDSDDSLAAVRQLVHRFNVDASVLISGMLDETMKWSALAASSIFTLPSYSEGLSMAVLEAMSMGLPVIISAQCHLPEVSRANAGLIIETSINALSDSIKHLLAKDHNFIRVLGQNGKSLVRDNYSWSAVAVKMTSLYRWATGGPRPQSFLIDEVR